MPRGETLEKRFWSKVDKSGECWIWQSAFTTKNYGFFWVGGEKRSEYAHRVSWELSNGVKVPPNKVVMHSCDNPRCVNPSHLSVGSVQDNKNDSVAKRRHAFGERNGGGKKLTWDDVREIRALAGKFGRITTARLFHIHPSIVKKIRQNKLWKEHA